MKKRILSLVIIGVVLMVIIVVIRILLNKEIHKIDYILLAVSVLVAAIIPTLKKRNKT